MDKNIAIRDYSNLGLKQWERGFWTYYTRVQVILTGTCPGNPQNDRLGLYSPGHRVRVSGTRYLGTWYRVLYPVPVRHWATVNDRLKSERLSDQQKKFRPAAAVLSDHFVSPPTPPLVHACRRCRVCPPHYLQLSLLGVTTSFALDLRPRGRD